MNESDGVWLLPMPAPHDRPTRTVLFALRRMAIHGVRDASACWLMLDLFRTGFRRPLVLLRAFMLELSHASRWPIRVAPCCSPRMTEDESLILRILFGSANDLSAAEDLLVEVTRNPDVAEALSAAAVFGRTLAATTSHGRV